MTVYFIGAGPGAADLLTLRADRLIRSCPVCLYAGSIVPPEVLANCPDDAEVINTARMPLEDIVDVIAKAHAEGKDVARLQSGDPSVWSALAEQARRLTAAGIDYEIVPGVASFSAVAAALGHELTVPTVGQSVILTRVSGRARKVLLDAAAQLSARLPPGERPPASMMADHIFALSHGVVELFLRGQPGGRSPIPPGEMLESGVLIYLRGLGLIPG